MRIARCPCDTIRTIYSDDREFNCINRIITRTSMATCQVCNNFQPYPKPDHIATLGISELNASIQRGCRNCALIRDGVAEFWDVANPLLQFRIRSPTSTATEFVVQRFWPNGDNRLEEEERLEFLVFEGNSFMRCLSQVSSRHPSS